MEGIFGSYDKDIFTIIVNNIYGLIILTLVVQVRCVQKVFIFQVSSFCILTKKFKSKTGASSKPCIQVIGRSKFEKDLRQGSPGEALGKHTGRFDSNFSHIFKSNTKFELLYERSSKVNLHVKYSAK